MREACVHKCLTCDVGTKWHQSTLNVFSFFVLSAIDIFFCAALSGERREVGEWSLNSVSENNSLLDFGAFNSQCADKKFLAVKWDWFFFFGKFPWVNKVFIIIVRTRGNLTPVNFSSSFLFGVFQCGKETSCCRRRVYQYEMDEWHATSGMKKIFQYFLRQNTPTEPKRCQTRQTYESKSI